MQKLNRAQIIEVFHLAFLGVLQTRLDQACYVLKGGANLRYFFDGMRYSEDIDLDMNEVEPWMLAEKIDGVLGSRAMGLILRSSGLGVAGFTKPKQTATTRRWTVLVEAPGWPEPIRTKIEFSNRNGDRRRLLEPVPSRIVEPYALRPPSLQHYTTDAATEQKVKALAGRSETQARDVFDLDLLLRRRSLTTGSVDPQVLTDARDRALELPFAAFRDQVLPFIEPEVAEPHAPAVSWEQMQIFVAGKLEEAR